MSQYRVTMLVEAPSLPEAASKVLWTEEAEPVNYISEFWIEEESK